MCKLFKCSPILFFIFRVEKYEKGEIKRENIISDAYKVYKEHVKFLLDEIK
jgi:hypothetical protein